MQKNICEDTSIKSSRRLDNIEDITPPSSLAHVSIFASLDGDFDDANETVATILPTQSPSSHLINFTVPVNAIPGNSRMRIVMQNNQWQLQNQANACDYNIAWFGETEDSPFGCARDHPRGLFSPDSDGGWGV